MSQLKIRYNSYICPYLYPIFLKRRIENIKNRKKTMGQLDKTDVEILQVLQKDAKVNTKELF